MPIRDSNGSALPTTEDLQIQISQLGIQYAGKKKKIKDMEADAGKDKVKIMSFINEHTDLFDVNGNHLEINAPAGDGLNEVFIQLQRRKSVSTVDNVIDALREKLGSAVDNYITTVEVLHENALESMFDNGLITKKDIDKLVVEKTVESLVVKLNKKKS